MAAKSVLQQVGDKKADFGELAARAAKEPRVLAELFRGLDAEAGRVRYGCEKTLRLVSESHPELIYPQIDTYIGLLDSEDAFLRWGAILMIGNLARVDRENKIDRILDKYLIPVKGPGLVTAGNTIAGAARIARAKPYLAGRIAREFLKVERAAYQGPHSRNVVLGRAIEALNHFLDHVPDKPAMVEFVRRQLANPRPVTKRQAVQFLERHKGKAAIPA